MPEANNTTENADDGTRPQRLLVHVADLRKRLGQRQDEQLDILLGQQTVVGSRTAPKPVLGQVVVESIERGVSVYGSAQFHWEGDCRRCLEITGGSLDVSIDEIFQIDAPEDSDLIAFDGTQIDLIPVVRDAVLLSLPLVPLCGPDCAGPDPDRYPTVTVEQREREKAAEAAEQPDPRWAALDLLNFPEDA